ncbi:MAG TPA: Ig-like domain-containing protein [Thermoanaerobaculia bacterium]|nr:Ig-like domain-containing protein [Thermoanaerobaculia bacterium]
MAPRKRFLRLILAVAVAGVSTAAFAQLDSSCMVSAFNRTAPVQADGVWVLPNVPAGLGPVRVRATCVQNGFVRFGASAFLTVPPNGTVKVEDIQFQGPPPVPSSLSLVSPQPVLSAIGQTVQLSAFVTYSDGSTTDATAADKGTDYRSSNPAIASVDANGLVTAHASGVVVVSAADEGALGVIRLQVVTSGDSDGDGLPDDWELAHGLDPNNPVDALDDPDQDGLTTLAEYQGGTNPFHPDSDGDGLPDGREIELRTNPLLADTDGDGLRDGLEVRTGSDPLDPASFNLAAALQSLTVTPGQVRIVFNTVFGEASRQLKVTGQLIDGTSLDVTSRRYGTAYASSDLTIANFGPGDGRVFAGRNGEALITAAVGGFSGRANVAVETFSPRALSFLDLPGYPNAVALAGNYAFVAAGATGLQVVDVTNLQAPVLVASVDTPGNANDVRIVGSHAFVADGITGVVVVDVSDPLSPRIVGLESTAGPATDLVVADGKAYVADEAGLSIVQISDPAHPLFLGAISLPGRARGVDVTGNLAVVAASSAGIFTIDVTDPANPVIVGQTPTRPDGPSNAADVTIHERLAYVADGAPRVLGGVRIVDFRDAANPVVVGSSGDAYGLTSVAFDRGLVLASDYFFVNSVPIFGGDPGTVLLRSLVDFSRYNDDEGESLTVREGVVFLVASKCCTQREDNGATGGGALFIGRYAVSEEGDATPPTASLTAPQPGGTAGERTFLKLRAEAHDDGVVDSVQFLVNGQPVFTDYTSPYEYTLQVPTGSAPRITIGAVATDLAGNQGQAQEVEVAVTPNSQAPNVALLAPVAGQAVTEGTFLTVAAQANDDQGVVKVEFRVNGTLVASITTPPYRFTYQAPSGVSELVVTAVAYDNFGPSAPAGPVTVPVKPDTPPTAILLAPRDGAQVVEGTPVRIVAGASDDIGVRTVEILIDGVPRVILISPFQWEVPAPPAGETMRIQAVAEDTRFHRTPSSEITITSISDPLTTIHGRTVDAAGVPVAGARVEAGGSFVLSAGDGFFSLAGLSTTSGDLQLDASAVVDAFTLHSRVAEPIPPIPGEVIEVGNVEMTRDDPGTTVTGRVVDEAGTPLPGATVRIYDDQAVFTASTDPEGRFTVAGVPATQSFTVSATVTVAGTRLRGVIGGSPSGLEITDASDVVVYPMDELPDPGTTVTGTVLGSFTDQPVAGARVFVFTSFDAFPTRTGEDGTFSISGVPTADGYLFAAASAVIEGQLWKGGSVSVPGEPDGTTDLGSFYLTPGGIGQVLLPPGFLPLQRSIPWTARRFDAPVCRAALGGL